jgi:hypothetical protein
MKTCLVFRTEARALKTEEADRHNYREGDQVQFEAVIFSDGKVAQRWLTETGAIAIWDSWEDLCKVHIYAHPDYGTRVEWSTGEVENL